MYRGRIGLWRSGKILIHRGPIVPFMLKGATGQRHRWGEGCCGGMFGWLP